MATNSVFVDTSFVVSLINDRDQYYNQAQAISYTFENSPLITTDAVLLEIGNALARDFRKEAIEIIKVLRSGKNTEVIEIDMTLFAKKRLIHTYTGDASLQTYIRFYEVAFRMTP